MFKFILLLFVVSFGLSTKVLGGAPEPARWAEDDIENPESFYKRTKLECIRDGIQKATGITPSPKYLAAIAMKVVNSDSRFMPKKKDNPLSFIDKENYEYRFLYLHTVARYVSDFGICPYDPNEKEGPGKFKSDEDIKTVNNYLSKNTDIKKDTVSQILVGRDYDFIDLSFPSRLNGKEVPYRVLSDSQRKELVVSGMNHADSKKPLLGLFGRDPFFHCVPTLQEYQKKNGVTVNLTEKTSERITPQVLCQSMMNSCGYQKASKACTDNGDFLEEGSPRNRGLRDEEVPESSTRGSR